MVTDDLVWAVYTLGVRDLTEIRNGIPQLQVALDRYRNNFDTFRQCMKLAGDRPMLQIEDDIELCNNFQERVMQEINARPTDCITFFSGQRNYTESFYYKSPMDYSWNQCFYWPPGAAKRFLHFSYLWKLRVWGSTGTDTCMRYFMKHYKYRLYQVVPNLVQHLDYISNIRPGRSTKRQSPNFVK